jgi:hypothetical protein
MVAGEPWTLLLSLEDDPDSLGCWLRVQELTMDGLTADSWERYYPQVAEALRELEMGYGLGPEDWTELE